MTEDDDDIEWRKLRPVLRGPHARRALAELLAPAAPKLGIDMSAVCRLDAYGAAVVRCAIDVHLERQATGDVTVKPPTNAETRRIACDVLMGLPSRCRWDAKDEGEQPVSNVIVPAMSVSDDEIAALIVQMCLPEAAEILGLQRSELGALQVAAEEFVANAEEHAHDASVPVVLAACLEEEGNDLQIVAVDVGATFARKHDPESALRKAISVSRQRRGALYGLGTLRRGGMDASLRLAAGSATAWSRTGQSWHYDGGPSVPGFIAGLEVHRAGTRQDR